MISLSNRNLYTIPVIQSRRANYFGLVTMLIARSKSPPRQPLSSRGCAQNHSLSFQKQTSKYHKLTGAHAGYSGFPDLIPPHSLISSLHYRPATTITPRGLAYLSSLPYPSPPTSPALPSMLLSGLADRPMSTRRTTLTSCECLSGGIAVIVLLCLFAMDVVCGRSSDRGSRELRGGRGANARYCNTWYIFQ